jgi:hypothetical protein
VPTLLARARRGVAMELAIDLRTARLCDAPTFESTPAPVFVVDTERFHPLERDADLVVLVRAFEEFEGRRARRTGEAPG